MKLLVIINARGLQIENKINWAFENKTMYLKKKKKKI